MQHAPDRPHVFKEIGNALLAHVPRNFDDGEIENWVNKTKPLGDMLWKLAPTSESNPVNRIDCPAGGVHVILTIGGVDYDPHSGPNPIQESNLPVDEVVGQLTDVVANASKELPRMKEPILTLEGWGLPSLLPYKQTMSRKMCDFLQEVMRGDSPVTPLEREIIAFTIATAKRSGWCAQVHKQCAIEMAGSIEEVKRIASTERLTVLGTFAVATSLGVPPQEMYIKRVKEQGWSVQAIHDVIAVGSAVLMMATYVEGLAARTPDGPKHEAFIKAGKRLATIGYTYECVVSSS